MDKSQISYGALVTLIADVILLLSGIGSEIIIGGLAAALFIIFIIINSVKLMYGSCTKDNESMNWKAIGSYALGSISITIIVFVVSVLAIV